VHGGVLWMERLVSIDVDMIAYIIGFPTTGDKPETDLEEKPKEKVIAEEMKNKFNTDKGSRGLIINRINEHVTRLATNLLACQLLRKCHKEEALAGVIVTVA
jgi:hypothetical protein